jgi:hypothetical protein
MSLIQRHSSLLVPWIVLLILSCDGKGIVADHSEEAAENLLSGWGQHQYAYDPSMLPMPSDASVEHAHGIVINDDGTILVTYKDATSANKCLVRWKRDSRRHPAEWLGRDTQLCRGVPHGLILAKEEDEDFSTVLYHANNEQLLHKTTLTGEILWTVEGNPISSSTVRQQKGKDGPYRPTWFASQPGSPFLFLADGYGSNCIFVLDRQTGSFSGQVFGGPGTDHGFFQTCHSIAWDDRTQQMVVCDRENHRLEYFDVDPSGPSVFQYSHTVSFHPLLKRPCNIRVRSKDGYAIVPFLEGSVGILDEHNNLISYINISDSLGTKGFLHPHDAHFVPGTEGDFVAVFWNPGRIGYFRLQQPQQQQQ